MGIYIRGMEMPKGCAFCRIGKRNGKKMVCPLCDEEWDVHDPMSADHRLDNCPLVPVPPHGRLGDLDALYEVVKKRTRNWAGGWNDIMCALTGDDIKNAPTIIPAEQKGE